MPVINFDFTNKPPYVRPINDAFDFDFSGAIEPPEKGAYIGINVGVTWQHSTAVHQTLAANNSAFTIATVRQMHWRGNSIQKHEHLYEHCEPVTTQRITHKWQFIESELHQTTVRWNLSATHQNSVAPAWTSKPAFRLDHWTRWQYLPAEHIGPLVRWCDGIKVELRQYLGWFGDAMRSAANVTWGPPQPRWVCTNRWFDLSPQSPLALLFDEVYSIKESPIALEFDVIPAVCEWDAGGGFIPGNPTLPPIDFKVPIQPQIRRMYLMQPLLTCVRAADEQPIAISAVSISNSRSQFASSVSLTFCSKGDAIRAENNLLRIGINGYDFYAYAEQPSRSEAWNNNSYQSNGRGRTAELSTPWRRAISYSNSAARSIGGIASDLLQNTGWTVDVSAINDFTVPAGVCTISNTPIDALNEIASMIGCMLAADDETKVISILPRWPTVPWSMSSATPDVVISDSVILGHSVSTTVNPLCNACWLRGEQQGISAKVTRDGSAGDLPTDDISNTLIVDTQAARLAGTAALADTGEKQQISLTLPIMADLPPFKKGQLVGITWRGEQYRALCDSVNITATMNNDGRLTVRQQITVIRSME